MGVSVCFFFNFQDKFYPHSIVVAYINTMKTIDDFNFDLYQAFKQRGYTEAWKQRETFN